ncbi:MAG: hypothetical protein JW891_17610 [Candidatus Lokiarchaeota archaeon]|nr:hypothetical protein [Candidatus Lokiarchaeota archaeon]
MIQLSSSEQNIKNITLSLIKKREAIIDAIEKEVLPSKDISALFTTSDYSKWSKWRSLIFRCTNPFILFSQNLLSSDLSNFFISLSWLLIWASWGKWISEIFKVVFDTTRSRNVSIALPWWSYFYLAILVLSVFMSIPIYIHTFLFIKHNKGKTRTCWGILQVSFLILFFYLMKKWYPQTFPSVLAQPNRMYLFLITLILFIFPFSIYTCSIILIGVKVIIKFVSIALQNFIFANNPYTSEPIKEILSLSFQEETTSWGIIDLSVEELKSIREWSRDNLESTERRLAPSFWFLTLIGIFANTKPFEDWVGGWVNYFNVQHNIMENRESIFTLPLETLIFFISIIVVIPVLLIIVAAYIFIFQNIVTQSLLIETCTVALFSKTEQVNSEKDNITLPIRNKTWFFRLLKNNIFAKMLKTIYRDDSKRLDGQ